MASLSKARTELVKIAAIAAVLPKAKVSIEFEDDDGSLIRWMRAEGAKVVTVPVSFGDVMDEAEISIGTMAVRAQHTRKPVNGERAGLRVVGK